MKTTDMGPTQRARLAWTETATTTALLIALAAFGWLGSYTRLVADDYNSYAPATAALALTIDAYHEWTGCFSSGVLINLVVPSGIGMVRALPAIALTLWMFALWWLFLELPAIRQTHWRNGLFAAAAILWATIESALSAGQSLYWATGLVKYTAPLVLHTFLAAAILWRVRTAQTAKRRRGPRWLVDVLIALVAFLASGFSETSLSLQAASAVVALLLAPSRADSGLLRRLLWLTLLATLAAGLVVALAPGNAIRQSALATTSAPILVLPRALLIGPASAARLLLCKPATAVVLLAAGWLFFGGVSNAPAARKQVSLILLSAWALTTAAALPASYTLGLPPPSRAHIAVQFPLVLAVFACGYVLGTLSAGFRPSWVARLFVPASCVLLIGIPLWSAVDLFARFPAAARYANAWDARDQRLRAAARTLDMDVTVEPLPEEMAIVLGLDIPGRDPLADANQILANYYRLRLFKVNENSPPDNREPWTQEWCGRLYHRLHQSGTLGELLELPAPRTP